MIANASMATSGTNRKKNASLISIAALRRLLSGYMTCKANATAGHTRIRNMPKEVRIDEIDKLSDYMSGIWSDYNVVKESCEGHEEFGHRHLGVLGDFFKGFAQGFVGVFEDVIDIAGGVFSGAVGFVDDVFNGENVFDSLACNAVKTNTKVLGKLIDLKFNIATGGTAKLAKKVCQSCQAASQTCEKYLPHRLRSEQVHSFG